MGEADRLTECGRISSTDPERKTAMQAELADLDRFLAAAEAAATTTAPPPRTTTPPQIGPLPVVRLDCGSPVGGYYDWYRIDFGYFYSGSEIVEWGMAYGDGKSYNAHDEATAKSTVFGTSTDRPVCIRLSRG